ncbi:branched-chain amino acid ABC transporter permease [Rhodopila sp.]|jgi:branched-chain amino acid transport system permease protein|uniref:branched-chain amino acid ABC transporter permease n=1 Tax=Rhodopila sp. TaxID=2480087 RepID=UPI002C095CC8|nr:branched-chain amino acid ABC transporter permease [Rhodopila sp.]HVZ07008.1 branched-chain amino acid ABC transporter permease [Rhodopila sp.]
MIDPVILLQILWTGIAMSSYFVLFTVAFALTLKVEKLWNFAQAGLMGIAFYTMFWTLNAGHWPVWAGIAAAVVVTCAVTVGVEVWAVDVLRRRHSSGLIFFIFTLIFSQFVSFLLTLLFGTEPETIFPSVMSPVRIIAGIAVTDWDLQAVGLTLGLLIALYLLIRFTRDGQFMVAVADNEKLAGIYGISAMRAYLLSGVIAALLIVAGIWLYGTRAGVTPDVPIGLILTAVIATLIGGLGRVFSAALAAVGLALLQSFSILFIASKWQTLLLYCVLFVALLVFPRGIPVWRRRVRTPPVPAPPVAAQAGG